MTLLLDTQVVVWYYRADRQLGLVARAAIDANLTRTWVSAASAWEAAIKYASGRLPLPASPDELLSDTGLKAAGFQSIPIRTAHAIVAGALPRHHADPFDRMLIAQAQLEDFTVVTSDLVFEKYDVRVLDART